MWDVQLDPSTNSAEIVPVRGAEFTANVTQFLQPPIANKHLMGIEINNETDWITGYVNVDVIFTHPFPGLDVYTGFDVRGVCIGNGSISGIADGDIYYAGEEELRILDPDGLTRWFNPTEFSNYETILGFTLGKLGTPVLTFNGTLNGYKYYCDTIDNQDKVEEFFDDPGCQNPRGYFTAGNTIRRTYELQFPAPGGMPDYQFQYAVVASWENPVNDPPEIPDDFELTANCQEAYCLSAADMSDMFYIDPGTAGGTLALEVRIFDHQGFQNSAGWAGEIAAISLESPDGLIPTGLATFDSVALAGAIVGQDEKSATYYLEVPDVTPPNAGEFNILIEVDNAEPADYDSGFPGFAFPDGPLAAYFMTKVGVGSNVPPTVISIDPVEGNLDQVLTEVEVTGTNFIDGAAVSLIKNDDPSVVIEASNESMVGGTLIVCDLDLSQGAGAEAGIYNVRVTNPGGLFGELADGFEITVSEWPYWWENNMYHSSAIGYNPMAESPDPQDWQLMWSVTAPQTYKNITPLIAENKVFFLSYTSYYDYSLTARVYCYDLTSGAQLWNARVNYSLTTPRINAGFAYYKDGEDEYIVAAVDQIYCFDANSTGTNPPALWTFDDTSPNDANWIGSQMVIDNGKVLAKCRNQASLHILDVTDGTLLHEAAISGGGEAGVSAADGKAYAISGANLNCVDINTGTLDWTTNLGYSCVLWVSPCLDEGRAYVSTQGGHIVCVALTDEGVYSAGDIIWDYNLPTTAFSAGGCSKLGDDIFVSIVYSSNRVYAVTDNGDNASLKWQSAVTGYWDAVPTAITTPSYPNGVVVIPERYSGTIYFLDVATGLNVHTIATGDSTFRAGASFAGEYMVVVGGSNLRVYYEP